MPLLLHLVMLEARSGEARVAARLVMVAFASGKPVFQMYMGYKLPGQGGAVPKHTQTNKLQFTSEVVVLFTMLGPMWPMRCPCLPDDVFR